MKLWLLQRLGKDFGYDEVIQYVIIAADEEGARQMAERMGGDETNRRSGFWTQPTLTSCAELTADNWPQPVVIVRSFNAG